ncbi:hypothetical protein F2Q68_00005097 [Brassica cretica]|uniref:Uncharacterized protein n=1 Tax=Brassica cretica TaxID=69181 RepID=A0A8S9JD16_BRACR|nr:hypothetical protein F2Q68_00005097 [Brassica cretica]
MEDVARPVSFLGEAVAKQVLAISRRFRRVPFLVSKEVLRHSRLWGNIARLPASVLYDEYQQAGTRRRGSFYTPPPRLARAVPSTAGFRPDSVGVSTGGAPLMGILQRLLAELFLLRNRVRDMVAQRDLLIWKVRASARWELMEEWLEGRTEHWDREGKCRQLWYEGLNHHSGGFFQVGLRKPLSDLEGAGLSENPRARLTLLSTSGEAGYYRVLPDFCTFAPCYYSTFAIIPCVPCSIDGILGLAQTHFYLMSHIRFVFLWSYHFPLRVGQDRRSLGPDPARLPL